MNRSPQANSSGQLGRKVYHLKKESLGEKNDIYSSTEESIKEQTSICKKKFLQKRNQYELMDGLASKKPKEQRGSSKNINVAYPHKNLLGHSEKVITVKKYQKLPNKPVNQLEKNYDYFDSNNKKNQDEATSLIYPHQRNVNQPEKRIYHKKISLSPFKNINLQANINQEKQCNEEDQAAKDKDKSIKNESNKISPRGLAKNNSWYPSNNSSAGNINPERTSFLAKNGSPGKINNLEKHQVVQKIQLKGSQTQKNRNAQKHDERDIGREKKIKKNFALPQFQIGKKKQFFKLPMNAPGPYNSFSPTSKGEKIKSHDKHRLLQQANPNKSPGVTSKKFLEKSSSFDKQKFISPRTKRSLHKSNSQNLQKIFKPNSSLTPKNKHFQKITFLKVSQNITTPITFIILNKVTEHNETSIYRCIHPETGFLCCIKKCKVNQKNIHLLINQHKIGISLSHPNLVKSYCSFYDNQYLYLLMEYMEGGILLPHEIIKEKSRRDNQIKQKNPIISPINARHTVSAIRNNSAQVDIPNFFAKQILKQILVGIKYIHDQKICHRDIKPENIFISHNIFKIGDFGSSCFSGAHESIGTLDYAAPEILLKLPYTQAIDMWSFGCVAYELDVGKPPFYHEDRSETMRRITCVQFALDQVKDIVLRHLISKLLVKDGQKRLSAEQALSHSLFDQIESSSNENKL